MNAMSAMHLNALELRERVRVAAERADRDPQAITIIAVSKTFDRAAMDEAYELGFRIFGESRVQEIRQKCEVPLPAGAELHMIGPLQTNKVRQLLPFIQVLETLDRPGLIEALARELQRGQGSLKVMVQVNVSGEPQKSGLATDDVGAFLQAMTDEPQLEPIGFMMMAPLDADESALHAVFGGLRTLRDTWQQQLGIELPALSMGMSGDFEQAIAEGATHIRIGRSLFGQRS